MQMQYYLKYPDKHKQQAAAYRKKNQALCRQWSRDSYHRQKNNPENIKKYLWKYAKARAVKRGLEFTILVDDIKLPEICPILKVPFDRNTVRYGYSVDRIDPTKGYTPDNIWVISQLANAMKWNSNQEERLAFAQWVLEGEGGYMP